MPKIYRKTQDGVLRLVDVSISNMTSVEYKDWLGTLSPQQRWEFDNGPVPQGTVPTSRYVDGCVRPNPSQMRQMDPLPKEVPQTIKNYDAWMAPLAGIMGKKASQER